MEYFKYMAVSPELPIPIKEWKRYVDDVFSIIPKGKQDTMLNYLDSIDPHIKFTVEQPNAEGAIPFLDTLLQPKVEDISQFTGNLLTQIGIWTSTPVTLFWLKELW